MTTEEQLAELRTAWLAAKAVADQKPGDAAADLFGPDHWITRRQREQCDHPAGYDPDDTPEGEPLPECAGHHLAVLVAREFRNRW